MAKETISQTEGLCKEVANCIRNAYDRGYKQGVKDAEKEARKKEYWEQGYNEGLKDAWTCCRDMEEILFDVDNDKFSEIFGAPDFHSALTHFDAKKCMQKIKEYEENQKQDEKSCDECSWKYTADDDYDEWRKHCLECINRCCFEPMRTDNKIKVGDKVSDGLGGTGVVTMITPMKIAYVLWDDGSTGSRKLEDIKKIGRYFDQITEVLEQLKGE